MVFSTGSGPAALRSAAPVVPTLGSERLWDEPSAGLDAAVGELLDQAIAGVGQTMHGDTFHGRGRHVAISAKGIDIVRAVTMSGLLSTSVTSDGTERLLVSGHDVTEALDWIDDIVGALWDTLDDIGTTAPVNTWLCVLGAEWPRHDQLLTVRGCRVVRYSALAVELRRRRPATAA